MCMCKCSCSCNEKKSSEKTTYEKTPYEVKYERILREDAEAAREKNRR